LSRPGLRFNTPGSLTCRAPRQTRHCADFIKWIYGASFAAAGGAPSAD